MDDQRTDRARSGVSPLRFRLSTMLAVITVICIAAIVAAWIANLFAWKQRRQAFLAELAQDCKSRGAQMASYEPSPDVRAPAMLWLVDESGIARIYVLGEKLDTSTSTEIDKRRARKAKALFPEAEIFIAHWNQSLGINNFSGTKFDE